FFENGRRLPAQISQTWGQYLSWVKEDDEWTGRWTGHPEGYVDVESLNLSDSDSEIVIWAKQGRLDGTVASRELCRSFPLFNYVLLDGAVSGDSAEVLVFDFVFGRQVN